MFQYAFGRYLSHRHKTPLLLDPVFYGSQTMRSFDLDVFNIQAEMAGEKQRALFELPPDPSFLAKLSFRLRRLFRNYPFVIEKQFSFSPELLEVPASAYVEGYFQTEKYFSSIKALIKNDFTFRVPMDARNAAMHGRITGSDSVSVHIRRGDYVSNPYTNTIHGTCSIDYYRDAIAHIRSKVENPSFFIFSDDIEWAKQHLLPGEKAEFIDFNTGEKSYEDLRLMSSCRHNIIANSSFSWWGAWLNGNENKIVIAPQKWFNDPSKDTRDLIPETWLRI